MKKNEILQKEKKLNDINYIDIDKDHLQVDIIYSEEHYQAEYKNLHELKKQSIKDLLKISSSKGKNIRIKRPVLKKLSRGKSQFLEFNMKEQELEKNKSLKKDHTGKS